MINSVTKNVYFCSHCRHQESDKPQPSMVYSVQVRQPGAFYFITKDCCAIAQCTDTGTITKKFHIVERVKRDDEECEWYCSCLAETGCMHAAEACNLWPDLNEQADNESEENHTDNEVIRLADSVFAVKFENSYSVLCRTLKLVKCLV